MILQATGAHREVIINAPPRIRRVPTRSLSSVSQKNSSCVTHASYTPAARPTRGNKFRAAGERTFIGARDPREFRAIELTKRTVIPIYPSGPGVPYRHRDLGWVGGRAGGGQGGGSGFREGMTRRAEGEHVIGGDAVYFYETARSYITVLFIWVL